MQKVKPPEWSARVNSVLWSMKMPKKELAAILGVNYTEMCSVILGYRVHPRMAEQILSKIDELERGVVLGDVSDGV